MIFDISKQFFPVSWFACLMNLHFIGMTELATPSMWKVSQWIHFKERTFAEVDIFPLSANKNWSFNVDDFLRFRELVIGHNVINRLTYWYESIDSSCPAVSFTCVIDIQGRGLHKMTVSLLHGWLDVKKGSRFNLMRRSSNPGECRSNGPHVHFATTITYAPTVLNSGLFPKL